MDFYKDKFKLLRKKNRMTAAYVAQQIGRSRHAVTAWELGTRNPKESQIRILARVLEVNVSEISDLKEYQNDSLERKILHPEFAASVMKFARNDPEELLKMYQKAYRQVSEINEKILIEINNNSLIFNSLMNAIPSIIYIKDLNLKYIAVNEAFYKEFKLENDLKVHGRFDIDLFPAEDARQNHSEDEKVLLSGHSIIRRKAYIPCSRKRKVAYISKIPVTDSKNRTIGLIGVITDITTEEEANFKAELFNKVLSDNFTDGVWFAQQANSFYIYLNNAIEQIFGYTLEEANKIKDLWLNIVHPDDKETVYNAVMRNPEFTEKHLEYRIYRKDGALRWISTKICWGKIQNKVYAIGIVRDTTDAHF